MPSRRNPDSSGTVSDQSSRTVLQCLLDRDHDGASELRDRLHLLEQNNVTGLKQHIVIRNQSRFLCPIRTCHMSFSRADGLSRHIKRLSDNSHAHIASVMEQKYCQICPKSHRRQCDFWRHVRSLHPEADLEAWEIKNPQEGTLLMRSCTITTISGHTVGSRTVWDRLYNVEGI